MHKILIIIALSLTGVLAAQADSTGLQRDTNDVATVHLLAKYGSDGTSLRWGYGEADTWYANFREGVILDRRRVSPNPTEYQPIDIVKLLPAEELDALSTAERDEMVSLVRAMGYDDWENSLFTPGDDDMLDKRDNFLNRYAMYHFAADRSAVAARAAGLGYVDTDVAPGVTYAYRVRSQGTKKVVAIKVVAPVERKVRPLISSITGEEGAISISWERALHNRYFSGYFIERAGEGSESWERLNEVPFVQGYDPEHFDPAGPKFFTYRDSIGNETPHRYRLVGIDAFGDESKPSPAVIGVGQDRTAPPKPLLRVNLDEKTHLTKSLYWQQPEGEDVVSYHLQRRFNGKENIVIDFARPGDTLKVDELDEPGTYIYRLIAQDAAGNLAWSTEVYTTVFDLDPPARPTGLQAEVDSSGLIILTWDEGTDADLFGYNVYAADGNRRAFVRLTNQPHRYRRFVDTVSTNLLNEHRDYYVVATDKDFQYSEKSEVLRVRRPDKIPPAPAHVSDFKVLDDAVKLSLRPSHSRDAVTHQLLRREGKDGELAVLAEWTHPTLPPFNYLDSTVVRGTTYRYAYRATDDAGLQGKIVSEVEVTTKAERIPTPVLSGTTTNNVVELSWDQQVGAAAWQLYRKVNDGPETRVPTISGDRNGYLDGRVKTGQTVVYRLRLIRQDGRRSPFSEPFEISL